MFSCSHTWKADNGFKEGENGTEMRDMGMGANDPYADVPVVHARDAEMNDGGLRFRAGRPGFPDQFVTKYKLLDNHCTF